VGSIPFTPLSRPTAPLTGEVEKQKVLHVPLASLVYEGNCAWSDRAPIRYDHSRQRRCGKGGVGNKQVYLNSITSMSPNPHTHINTMMTYQHHETSHIVAIS